MIVATSTEIKPDNMMTGRGQNAGRLYLVDFGLGTRYYRYGGRHVSFTEMRAWQEPKCMPQYIRTGVRSFHGGTTWSLLDTQYWNGFKKGCPGIE